MEFIAKASHAYPNVKWTGASGIHVSHARVVELSIDFGYRGLILSMLNKHHMGNHIWSILQRKFSTMEFLIQEDAFVNLFMVDIDRHLRGKPSSSSPHQIQNPLTKNLFHRIALQAPFVGAIRFWAHNNGLGTEVGFRFRIVELEGENDEVNARAEALEMEAVVNTQIATVQEAMMDIKEPPAHVSQKIEQSMQVLIKE